jgi:hypothetical protein
MICLATEYSCMHSGNPIGNLRQRTAEKERLYRTKTAEKKSQDRRFIFYGCGRPILSLLYG